MSDDETITRRGMLVKIGLALNGVVATALAIPVVRYLLSPVARGQGRIRPGIRWRTGLRDRRWCASGANSCKLPRASFLRIISASRHPPIQIPFSSRSSTKCWACCRWNRAATQA